MDELFLSDEKLKQLVRLDASFSYIAKRYRIENHVLHWRLRELGLFEDIR